MNINNNEQNNIIRIIPQSINIANQNNANEEIFQNALDEEI